MLRRSLSIAFAAAAAWVLAVVPAAPALAAADVLSAGGVDLGVGDVLHGQLAPGTKATFFSSSGSSTGVTCTSSTFTATITGNPPAPGTATLSVTEVTFGDCATTNIPFVTGVRRITVIDLPYTVSVSSGGGVTVQGPVGATIVLIPAFGSDISCTYTGSSMSGTESNTTSAVSFSNQALTRSSGPGSCFGSGLFGASYVVTTATAQPVVVQ